MVRSVSARVSSSLSSRRAFAASRSAPPRSPIEETACGAFDAVCHYLRAYMMRGLRLEGLVEGGGEPSVLWQERAFAQAQVELQRVKPGP